MRKFLWSLVMCLCVALCSTTLTSCSSDDDGGTTLPTNEQAEQMLIGTWKLVSQEGYVLEDGLKITNPPIESNVVWIFTPDTFYQFDDYPYFDIALKNWSFKNGVFDGTFIEWDGGKWLKYDYSDNKEEIYQPIVTSLTESLMTIKSYDPDPEEGYNMTGTFRKISDSTTLPEQSENW